MAFSWSAMQFVLQISNAADIDHGNFSQANENRPDVSFANFEGITLDAKW